ncbi:DUF7269 family protein [Halorarius halobius]|uniref:DUF7269 family protein n=1 Tax=Halorarius halobius TaxID=2962671 RepID=UPI0020CCCF62|nr:hypothetical protein [Halorarius halobius]
MRRTLLVGAATALAGLAVVFVPALAVGFPVSYGLVLLVGALAFLFGLALVRARMATDRDTATLREVEARADQPVPGDGFDADLAAISPRRDRENDAARAQVRERLQAAALGVLSREGHPREEGLEMLDTGEWTDDPVAAAFFATEPVEADDDSLVDRLRGSTEARTGFRQQARRAALAVARRAGVADE